MTDSLREGLPLKPYVAEASGTLILNRIERQQANW